MAFNSLYMPDIGNVAMDLAGDTPKTRQIAEQKELNAEFLVKI